MVNRVRGSLSFSNVIASLALFVALGGTAYALSKDSVKSKHIVNGEVTGKDIKDSGIKSKDVKDGQIKGADVAANGLTGEQIDESALYPSGGGTGQNPYAVPIAGLFSGQARSIGGAGTVYASLTGRALATPTFAEAATGAGSATVEFGQLRVKLAAPLTAGQTRTFTVVRDFDLLGTPTTTSISCTISAGEDECTDPDRTESNNAFMAMDITSTGAGHVVAADAYFGMTARSITD